MSPLPANALDALPNKQLLETPQALVDGAHVLRHVRIYFDMRRSRIARRRQHQSTMEHPFTAQMLPTSPRLARGAVFTRTLGAS